MERARNKSIFFLSPPCCPDALGRPFDRLSPVLLQTLHHRPPCMSHDDYHCPSSITHSIRTSHSSHRLHTRSPTVQLLRCFQLTNHHSDSLFMLPHVRPTLSHHGILRMVDLV